LKSSKIPYCRRIRDKIWGKAIDDTTAYQALINNIKNRNNNTGRAIGNRYPD
jgi:curli production assembly/transport component CsgG